MLKIEINGETYFVEGVTGLVNLIEKIMGLDTRNAIEEFISGGLDLLEEEKVIDAINYFGEVFS